MDSKIFWTNSKRCKKLKEKNLLKHPITTQLNATYEDPNIQKPMIVASYRTPSMKTRDARVLDMISTYLSDGKSSRLYKKIVDDKKMALQIGAFSYQSRRLRNVHSLWNASR